jgi:hypothetical protein
MPRLRPLTLFALAAAAAFLAIAAPAQATIRHVFPGGSISGAVSASSPGDTVVVHGGSYPLQSITKAVEGPPVVVEGAAGDSVNVAGFSFSGGAKNIHLRSLRVAGRVKARNATRLRYERLTVDPGASSSLEGLMFDEGSADIVVSEVKVVSGRHAINLWAPPANKPAWPARIRVERSDLSGGRIDVVQVGAGRDLTFEDNFIHDPQANADHNDGIQVIAADGVRILRNTFTAPGPAGPDQAIIVGHMDPVDPLRRAANVRIENNLVHHWRGHGLILAGVDGADVVNNTIYDSGSDGKYASFNMSSKNDPANFANARVRVWNNIFYRMTVSAGSSRPALESHNLVRDGTGGGTALLHSDPSFVDRDSYRLAAVSPAVNSGNPLTDTPTIDRERTPRDAVPDRGALEYGGLAPAPPLVVAPVVFPAEADARVAEASPSTNYGTSSYLRIDGGSDPGVESVLRFSVSGLLGGIKSAKLRLYASTDTTDGPAVFSAGNAWTQTGVTWSSRPERRSAQLDDKSAITPNTWVEFDVTPVVTGNGTYSFTLATASSDGVNFRSREASSMRPELVVTPG